jgi:hypothetical protein
LLCPYSDPGCAVGVDDETRESGTKSADDRSVDLEPAHAGGLLEASVECGKEQRAFRARHCSPRTGRRDGTGRIKTPDVQVEANLTAVEAHKRDSIATRNRDASFIDSDC